MKKKPTPITKPPTHAELEAMSDTAIMAYFNRLDWTALRRMAKLLIIPPKTKGEMVALPASMKRDLLREISMNIFDAEYGGAE